MRFLNISFFVMFISHWIACLYNGMTQFGGDEDRISWYYLADLQDASVSEKYVNCLYWVITTTCTVGYGDLHPVNSIERVVVIFCMIIQSGTFAYIVGDIGRTVSNFNMLATHFRERMNYVETFLRQKDIPLSLFILGLWDSRKNVAQKTRSKISMKVSLVLPKSIISEEKIKNIFNRNDIA